MAKSKDAQMAESSDSNEDCEEKAKVGRTIDPTLRLSRDNQTRAFKTETQSANATNSKQVQKIIPKNTTAPCSSSGVTHLARCDGEFPNPFSLEVTPETQKMVAKKLSKALDKIIDEVPVRCKAADHNDLGDQGIYLFSSSSVRISARDTQNTEKSSKKQKKPQLRKKRHIDGSDSDDEDTKLRAVAVSAEWVKRKE